VSTGVFGAGAAEAAVDCDQLRFGISKERRSSVVRQDARLGTTIGGILGFPLI
jgi:hypothetical protein